MSQRKGSKTNRKTKAGGQFGVTRRSGDVDGYRSEIKREGEMAESKTFVPPGRRENVYRSITEDYF